MMTITRAEHLEWCKQRARQYCDRGDAANALLSMFSDMQKHQDTAKHPAVEMGLMLMMSGGLREPTEARKFIDGFN
jgi:hypothetical protein